MKKLILFILLIFTNNIYSQICTEKYNIDKQYDLKPNIQFENYNDFEEFCKSQKSKINILAFYNYRCSANSPKYDKLLELSKKKDVNLIFISPFDNCSEELTKNVNKLKEKGFDIGTFTLSEDSLIFKSKIIKFFNENIFNKKTFYLSYIILYDQDMKIIDIIENVYKKEAEEVKTILDEFTKKYIQDYIIKST